MSLIKASLLSFDLSRVTHQLWVTYFLTDRFFPGKTQAWWFFKQNLAWKGGAHVCVCACACVCRGWCLCDVQEGRRGRRRLAILGDKVPRGERASPGACRSWHKTPAPSCCRVLCASPAPGSPPTCLQNPSQDSTSPWNLPHSLLAPSQLSFNMHCLIVRLFPVQPLACNSLKGSMFPFLSHFWPTHNPPY